jgi:elongation factor G
VVWITRRSAPITPRRGPRRHARPGQEYREKLLEAAVELDDGLAVISTARSRTRRPQALIRKAVITGAFFPVLWLGVQEQGCSRCSTPWSTICRRPRRAPIKGIDEKGNEVIRGLDDKVPLALLAFKIMDDPACRHHHLCRIYSGTLTTGTGVVNSTRSARADRPCC